MGRHYERENPAPEEPAKTAQVSTDVAKGIAGRWTGRPRLITVDYEIFLEFTRNADGTIQGKLIDPRLKARDSGSTEVD
jgi:hypothetical protein